MTDTCDHASESSEEDHVDPADALMARGSYLRQLRELERLDEEARQHEEHNDKKEGSELKPQEMNDASGNYDKEAQSDTSSVAPNILDYSSYLSHQSYYDDLKHVDYKFIDYGRILLAENDDNDSKNSKNTKTSIDRETRNINEPIPTESTTITPTLVVEQDKRLGKGGLCWDAAFCLGEHLIRTQQEWKRTLEQYNANRPLDVVELGCGTGLCGMMVAKAVPNVCVSLTDLPELLPLLGRNVQRNFSSSYIKNPPRLVLSPESRAVCNQDGDVSNPDTTRRDILEPLLGARTSRGCISFFALDWNQVVAASKRDCEDDPQLQFDVLLGADVVATLYDPIALAHTIYCVAKDEHSWVYISFKERLSSIHRTFEKAMEDRFEEVHFVAPGDVLSRNKNPQVGILLAKKKRKNIV